jgi:hypothetical protein
MPAIEISVARDSVVLGGPRVAFVIKVFGKSLVMNAQYAKRKRYRERMIDGFLEELGNPPEEVKDSLEGMKEGGVKEGVFSIEEGEFQPGGT